MKNKRRIWLISFLCVGAGIVILILGLMLGGRPGFYIDGSGIHSAAENGGKRSYVKNEKELQEFTDIDIDLDYADFQIIPSDTFKIEYCLDGTKDPVCTVKDGRLTVREADYKRIFNFTFISPMSDDFTDSYVKLYIPENTVFDTIKILTEDGDILLPALKSDMLDLESDYGDITVKDFEGRRLFAELEDGSFSSKGIKVDELKLSNEYGDIALQDVKCAYLEAGLTDGDFTADSLSSDRLEIDSEYGDVFLGLSSTVKEYDLDLSTEYGSIQVPQYDVIYGDDGSQCRVANSSGKTVKVSSEDGDIQVFDAR